jgi:DNA-binding NarL/FixJ family response regulator
MLALGDIVVVGVAQTGDEAVQLVHALEPDVTLLDVDLGHASGFDIARQLERDTRGRTGAVILVSTHPEDDYADLIADSPVLGFLPKSTLTAAAIRNLLDLGK